MPDKNAVSKIKILPNSHSSLVNKLLVQFPNVIKNNILSSKTGNGGLSLVVVGNGIRNEV